MEFVNDVEYHCGALNKYKYGLIDTPLNILVNKITALWGRDEPKDVFDVYFLSCKYNFNWIYILEEAKKKAIFNEIEISQKINDFPVDLLKNVDWLVDFSKLNNMQESLKIIATDIIIGADNSLATSNKNKIQEAVLLVNNA